MKILVVAGSKHGSTLEVAGAIAATLRAAGHEASAKESAEVDEIAKYGAFVIGSAVYLGHWTKETREFVHEYASQLRGRPVWMFSCGPLGDPPIDLEEPTGIDELSVTLGAREHRLFSGALTKEGLSLLERTAVKAVHAPYGDFRDWREVQAWAGAIAAELDQQQR